MYFRSLKRQNIRVCIAIPLTHHLHSVFQFQTFSSFFLPFPEHLILQISLSLSRRHIHIHTYIYIFLFLSLLKDPAIGFMGANYSILSENEESERPLTPNLGDMPESCVASVLSYFDPPEICKLARLNRAFRGASSADFIWETKLPSNYIYIVQRLLDERVDSLGKKSIYAQLCRPNPFDGGTKEIWVDKSTGGVHLLISSKALTITGIDDRRYWNHIPTDESRFQTVAYLQQIWWLEVVGEFEFQFPAGTYSLFFRLQLGKTSKRLGRRVCNHEHVHGWDVKPVQFQLATSDGQHAVSRYFLDSPGNWVHYHGGDFVIQQPNELMKIKFSLTQIDCTHTKGGLCVDSVLICPSSLGKEYTKSLQ